MLRAPRNPDHKEGSKHLGSFQASSIFFSFLPSFLIPTPSSPPLPLLLYSLDNILSTFLLPVVIFWVHFFPLFPCNIN
ncbi:hypothetical protein F4804DRAFT_309296 [Jackrogersella minutella]|nr:hypothetical protein F4804DRAFT_309296 [Jackrogersella minutella]